MLFERNDARVLEAFRRGEFDYVDAIGEVSEADFFRVITERKISLPSALRQHDRGFWSGHGPQGHPSGDRRHFPALCWV
jgi:hypothetical protein